MTHTATPSRLRPSTLTLAVAAGALVLTATGGAVAGTMITGAQIKNGTITSLDVRDHGLRTRDLAPATVARLRGQGGPAGPAGPGGPAGSASGYAQVNGTLVTRQSGGVTVTNPSAGRFCVTFPGVSSANRVAVASLDWDFSNTGVGNNTAQGAIETSTSGCSAPAFGVRTFVRSFPDANTATLAEVNQGFTIMVP